MKKFICLLICAIIVMMNMCLFTAANNDSYTFEIDDVEYTVKINDPYVSAEKKQTIANAIVCQNNTDIMTVNVWCDIFGHDYKYTTASVMQHKVNVYAPRCKEQLYDVTYCEDCDYTEQKLISTSYINCCPED